MLVWPAFIQYEHDDELIFIADEAHWNNDPDLHFYGYSDQDRLVDSAGAIYTLKPSQDKKFIECIATGQSLSLHEFEGLVKAHLVALNQCCVEKIQLGSFAQGMLFVQEVTDFNI
ncbi:MAG: DUF4144 family protein [Gammaproteobacteria bacterium]|nr:DUF4144 family protein [Gammaproteobacteria bacterium]